MEGTVTISIKDFEKLRYKEVKLLEIENMLRAANKNGDEAVMTDELRKYIEEIYN